MPLVLGIGNPGSRYAGTRHNVGFEVIDRAAERAGVFFRKASSLAMIADLDDKTRLMKPLTFVNRSGEALAFYREHVEAVTPEEVLVVVDDVNLPIGATRLRAKGSSGGHNGLRDLEQAFGTSGYPRLRIGVGGVPRAVLVDHVLGVFEEEEREQLEASLERALRAVLGFAEGTPLLRLAESLNRTPGARDVDDDRRRNRGPEKE